MIKLDLCYLAAAYMCRITLNWIGKKGESIKTDGAVGESILEAAHRHDIELEGKPTSRSPSVSPSMKNCVISSASQQAYLYSVAMA